MFKNRSRIFVVSVLGLALAAVVATAAAAATNATPPGATPIPPTFAPAPSVRPSPEPPILRPTGGPYVGEGAALRIAAEVARGPVAKQDVRFMRYRDVVAFTGNRTFTIDLDREVYFVVTSATFVGRDGSPICASYMAVIDATTGDGLSVICGDGAWPSRLPTAFK